MILKYKINLFFITWIIKEVLWCNDVIFIVCLESLLLYLFSLPKLFFDEHISYFIENKIKIVISGEYQKLPKDTVLVLKDALEKTKNFDKKIFNIALNYGGRAELIRAIKNISQDVKENKIKIEDIDENLVSENLYTKGQPDPDLLIRTSGELRLSNFLPWQLVYTEFLFVDKNWPEFNEEDLDKAIIEYQRRTRKFGGK